MKLFNFALISLLGSLASSTPVVIDEFADTMRVIMENPDEPCLQETSFTAFTINTVLAGVSQQDLNALIIAGVQSLNIEFNQFRSEFDPEGEQLSQDPAQSDDITALVTNLRTFWGIPEDDLIALGGNGRQIEDPETVAMVYQNTAITRRTNETMEESRARAIDTVALINRTIGFDHPFLTLNVAALTNLGEDFLGNGEIQPDRLLFGAGFVESFSELFSPMGVAYTAAHEVSHILLFRAGIFGLDLLRNPTPETTRRFELSTDALAAYYLAHPLGGNFDMEMLVDLVYEQATFLGDCQFTNPGHHGTPIQRARAAMFGAEIAQDEGSTGIINVIDFFDRYLSNEASILDPAAPATEPPSVSKSKKSTKGKKGKDKKKSKKASSKGDRSLQGSRQNIVRGGRNAAVRA